MKSQHKETDKGGTCPPHIKKRPKPWHPPRPRPIPRLRLLGVTLQ